MKIDVVPKKNRFLSPTIDEVALFSRAQQILEGDAKTPSELDDTDLATALVYQQLLNNESSQLAQHIHKLPITACQGKGQIKVLIVPSMFYLEYPEVGGDGQLAAEIFRNNGFDCEIIPIKSRGSVTENKAIIHQYIQQQEHPNIWMLSISKGTADLRACLQQYSDGQFPENIKAWINFSGIFNGSIYADHRIDSKAKRFFLRKFCRLVKINYQLVEELQTHHSYWQQPMNFLDKIELIHVIGFPLRSHVQPLLSHRFNKLSEIGPTDGMINLSDTVNYPGHIIPLWGCDHFIRGQQISPLIYQLCHHMIST